MSGTFTYFTIPESHVVGIRNDPQAYNLISMTTIVRLSTPRSEHKACPGVRIRGQRNELLGKSFKTYNPAG